MGLMGIKCDNITEYRPIAIVSYTSLPPPPPPPTSVQLSMFKSAAISLINTSKLYHCDMLIVVCVIDTDGVVFSVFNVVLVINVVGTLSLSDDNDVLLFLGQTTLSSCTFSSLSPVLSSLDASSSSSLPPSLHVPIL